MTGLDPVTHAVGWKLAATKTHRGMAHWPVMQGRVGGRIKSGHDGHI
jgi:hypothetical protein